MSKHHPAIGNDEIDVWNACRQIQYPGAKVTVSNYSWESVKKGHFDSLYFRGLALRHSNGESGKYETFTYTPTEQLLAWARQQDLQRASFTDALQGRDVAKEIRNLRRRARYAMTAESPRSFPSPRDVQHQILIEAQSPLATANEDGQFSSRGLTDWYVSAWCRANHLKP